ncbi:dispanin subfamily A member 2b-like [Sinocyclocheilus anshuiensis]|uniref:Dispanin subfamily A member 2b-like n=1 Tax=Sinocyclocheilus anshuiensis TaxID=1608454 RepID=A0A671QXR3_9TELE|nr:PREDICTED: dispanin subfamily A member 2b-like [Sinocyclocheilus anshuiensis]
MAMQNYPAPGGILMQDNRVYTAQPVIVSMPDQNVNDDIIFSTFNLHFCNPCCLGFGAFYNSIKARDSRLLGDFPMARSYGARARRINIAAIVIGSISILIFIIVLVKSMSRLTSSYYHL